MASPSPSSTDATRNVVADPSSPQTSHESPAATDTPADAGATSSAAQGGAAAAAATTAATTTAPAANILPAWHWAAQQQPDDDNPGDDADSAYDTEETGSSTASLSASILEYRTVHGRTFHSERGNAQSWIPNDAQHEETMDLLHHVSTLQEDGKLFQAPIDDNVQKVLDVGCGTGIWAIDFADQYPSAEVIGVDISPPQPNWVPPNLKFEVDDVTLEWTYAPDSFDYVHMRWLVGAIPDWDELFREIYKVVKPGGYFESKESSSVITSDDGTVAEGSALDQWGKVFSEAGKKFGRTFRVVEEDIQRKAMEAAGFVDIQEYNFMTPIGGWPADPNLKEMGQFMQLALLQDIEGFLVYLWTTVMGWTKDEIRVYAAHLRREIKSGKHHAHYPQRTLVGRKPES